MLFEVSNLDLLTKFTTFIYHRGDLIEDQKSTSYSKEEIWEGQKMSLSNLLSRRIKEHHERGNIDKVHRLEDALCYIDGARPCTPE